MNETLNTIVNSVKENPVRTAAIVAGVVVVGVVAVKALQYVDAVPEELGTISNTLEEVAAEVV